MSAYKLESSYKPTGDQPEAIRQLAEGVMRGDAAQTLLGITGSGKTFTMANVIAAVGKPTLIVSHNKTLAAQLYGEMKRFFPQNAVEYYVSYYDYYQPEAYIASTDTYIEKDLAINDEIDRMRLATTSALLSGRRDVVVVSSVSCIYGMGNPAAFYENVIELFAGMVCAQSVLCRRLVDSLYTRNDAAPARGEFRVKGDTVDVFLAYSESVLRVSFWGDEVEGIEEIDGTTGRSIAVFSSYKVYPANLFLTGKETQEAAIRQIQDDLVVQAEVLRSCGKAIEAKRLEERVTYDIEMIREVGHCSGIENYSRYFDGRAPGTRPYCLLDFFPQDFLLIIDESHVSVPQIRAMYGGDRSRKTSLVEYGFRLPAALDNRPLRFDEFCDLTPQTIYVSATPDDYEIERSEGVVVEQVIRPTGLLDPPIEVRDTDFPLDDLIHEIQQTKARGHRVLVTTLTKRMAEELTAHLINLDIPTAYIHSDVDTLERIRILEDLRAGAYDVLVGVNLLREGLDLPEVALVAILDADKEGFLRSHRSLTQTAGRAARNVEGRVLMYAKTITTSMQQTIDETNRRREKQMAYNKAHHITPHQVVRPAGAPQAQPGPPGQQAAASGAERRGQNALLLPSSAGDIISAGNPALAGAAEQMARYGTLPLPERLRRLEAAMRLAAEQQDYVVAAQYRDEMLRLQAAGSTPLAPDANSGGRAVGKGGALVR